MKVLITGGTGSLGQALLKHANISSDASGRWDITVLSRDEVKQADLRAKYPEVRFMLGDVRDLDWLKIVFRGQDLVIHAAAYKQVPAAEVNAAEAIETNVIGSRNVARAAVECNVPRVVGISTDKACAPINCYGETKALMEKLFQAACKWGDTQFNLVRYGNVLGSRGSVLPLFRQQIANCERITVTDLNMTRFWLALDDAIALILEAASDKVPGSILVPLAKGSTMEALANAAFNYYSKECDRYESRIIATGIRPGEKMHEKLVHSGESMHAEVRNWRIRIHPAYAGFKNTEGTLGDNYELTSDEVPHYTTKELEELIACA